MQEHVHSHDGFIAHLLEELLEGLGASHKLTEFLIHLVIDAGEIFLLMFAVFFLVSFAGSYVNYHKLEHRLQHARGPAAYGLAVVLGMLSPFCSCSVVPIVMGFLAVGLPLGICITFLLSASLLNLSSLVVMPAALGGRMFGCYVISAALILFIVSLMFSKSPSSVHVQEPYLPHAHQHTSSKERLLGRIRAALSGTGHTMGQIWYWVILGVALSAAITSFLSYEALADFLNQNLILTMLISGLVGLALHSDIFSALPLLRLFLETSSGTTMTYLLSVMSISLAQIVLMTRVFRTRFILLYTGLLYVLALAAGGIVTLLWP